LFYFYLALATLAKGPVAVFFAGVILLVYVAFRRDWRAVAASLWIPGIMLFVVVAFPWYIEVQIRNPDFFRIFILEHNLGRFGQDLYHHRQPFWFYLPVLLLSLMPWTIWLLAALAEQFRSLRSKQWQASPTQERSWQMFLLIWLLVPVLFFSASQSKLPGYILPSIPAGALLVTDYLRRRQTENTKDSPWLFALHAALCGSLVFVAMAAPSIQLNHRLLTGTWTYIAAASGVLVMIGVAAALFRLGPRMLRPATMIPIVVGVAVLLRLAAPAIDATQSARPVAQTIQSFSHEAVPVALFHTTRQLEYGLEFYLNRPAQKYETEQVPREGHVLVVARNYNGQFGDSVRGRRVSFLTSVPAQKLDLYWVGPAE
jgi:4-amino-4-deoxy-L-arabinose transferase-like glycosyltransferase